MTPSHPIRITGKDGLAGAVEAKSRRRISQDGSIAIQLDDGRRVVVPGKLLQQQSDGTYYLPLGLAELENGQEAPGDNQKVIPLVEEELAVRKQPVEKGRTRIRKVVREREQVVDEPVVHEDVEIRRVPVNRYVDAPAPARQEGDTLIVPLFEEVLVVQKRLVLREELHVTRRRTTVHDRTHVPLRSEDVLVEHIDGHEAEDQPRPR